jgi:PAS domain S-box-containing protein
MVNTGKGDDGMGGSLYLVFLGWDERAGCLIETLGSQDLDVEVLGVAEAGQGQHWLPGALAVKSVSLQEAQREARGPLIVMDLRPGDPPRPHGLAQDAVWIPSVISSFLLETCRMAHDFRHYRDVVETARDAIVTIDESHRIIFFNRAAEEMFGYEKGEAIGRDLSIIIPSPHKERHREYVRRYIETRRGKFINHTVELNAERRNGEEFPISISFSVAEVGPHLLMTGMIRDITEMKDLERRVVQSERLASMGEALSYVTHEIKNPLMVIGGFARSLLKSSRFSEEEMKRLEIIVSEVQRLEALLAQIQDFTKPLLLEKEKVDLAAFVEDILPMFKEVAGERNVRLSLEIESRPTVMVDPDRLRQVVINLLKNAVEAIKREGTVKVRVREDPQAAIMEIEDDGEGIPQDRLKDIFEPFVTTKKEGSGLGLPLCRKIINDHGGEIRIWSRPGKGTRVRVEIPLETWPGQKTQ